MNNLKTRSLNALLWDLGGSLGQQGIGFIISIFLARLLLPEEFGLVGMAMVFIAIFQVFGDVGFASALIQNQNNESITYSSVFYLNIFLGSVLTVGVYLGAPLAGAFYENPEVTEVLRWLSLLFILNALNIVQQTILRRELKMKILNIRSFLAQFIGGIVGVTMALNGFGVYSLIGQSLSSSVTTTMFLWSVTDWYPTWEFSKKEVQKLTGYSSYIFFDQFFSKVFNELDTLFIGKVFSASTLGFFSRANSLNKVVSKYSSDSLKKVFFPVLSRLQGSRDRYFRVYYKVISVASFTAFGITGTLFILGESLIILLFGEKWQPSVLIFQILILKAFTYPISIMVNNAFLSKGKSKEFFWIGIFRKAIRIIPLIVGFIYGLNPFLIALVITSYFLMTCNILFSKRYIGTSVWRHMKGILEGVAILFFVVVLYYFYAPFSHVQNILLSILFIIIYLLFSYIRKNEGLIYLLKNSKEILRRI